MTNIVINDDVPYTQVIATNLQTQFDTDWTADAASDVDVYARATGVDADDVVDLVDPSEYVVTFIGTESIVRVTFNIGRTTGDVITIVMNMPIDFPVIYTNTNFTPSMLNGDFGRNALIDQQDRLYWQQIAIRYNTSETVDVPIDTVVPILSAGETWRKNSTNTGFETYVLPNSGLFASNATYLTLTDDTTDLPNSVPLSTLPTGILINDPGNAIFSRTLTGTTNQIDILNGDGISGDPTFSISSDPVIPGNAGIGIPQGTTAQRVVPAEGVNFRFNEDLGQLEYYNSGWIQVEDTAIGEYLLLAGGTMTGAIEMSTNKVTGLGDPTVGKDAANKDYIDTQLLSYLPLAGGTMLGQLDMNNNGIINVVDPTNPQDVGTKNYIDNEISAAGTNFLPLAGGTMSGDIDMGNTNKVINLDAPTAANDATTKNYVDTELLAFLLKSGGTMTGAIEMGTNKITGLGDPTLAQDAVTKNYSDQGTQTFLNKDIDLFFNTVVGTTSQFNTALSDGDFATLAGTEILTNKTISFANNNISTTISDLNAAVLDATLATLTGTQTLTNKSINLSSNTLTGTTAEFNTALTDNDFATLDGLETLTNKTLVSPTFTTSATCLDADFYIHRTTTAEPLQTFFSDVTGTDNQISLEINSQSRSDTDALKDKDAMIIRTINSVDAGFSESVTFEAYTNGAVVDWFKFDGGNGIYQDEATINTTTFNCSPILNIIGIAAQSPKMDLINTVVGATGIVGQIDMQIDDNMGGDKDFDPIAIVVQDATPTGYSTDILMNGYFNGTLRTYLEANGQNNNVRLFNHFYFYDELDPNGARAELEQIRIKDSTVASLSTIGLVPALNPCFTFKAICDETINVGAVVTASPTTDFRIVNHPTGGDDRAFGVCVVAGTLNNPAEYCWAGMVPVQLEDGTSASREDLIVPSNAQAGRAVVDNSPGIRQSFGVAWENVAAATPGNLVWISMTAGSTS